MARHSVYPARGSSIPIIYVRIVIRAQETLHYFSTSPRRKDFFAHESLSKECFRRRLSMLYVIHDVQHSY